MNNTALGVILIIFGVGLLFLMGCFVNSKDHVSKGRKNIRSSLLPIELEKKRMIEREQTVSLVSVPKSKSESTTVASDNLADSKPSPSSMPNQHL